MRSLRAKLSAAFIGIAILTTVLSATFATYEARNTFREYVERHTQPSERENRPELGPFPGSPGRTMPHPPGHPPFGVRERLFSSRIRDAIWGGTLAAAAAGVLVALWLTRRIVKPVSELTQASRAIARGQAPPQVPVHGQDEIAELSRAFNLMAARLAEDEERRRQLFAGVVHELRTPLSVIQGTLEGMLDRVIEPTPERLAGLHSQAVLLKRLITDLRDLSLAQAGQLRLHMQKVDISAIVRDSVEGLAPLFEERGVALRVEAPKSLPPVDADPDRLRQVVQNLVENAVRHTQQGGNVRIILTEAPGGVRLVVSDTGTGIEAKDLPHIFEHFYRADQSRARSSGGTGLGLAIVKSLVEAHRGRVAVESAPGAGSVFTVTLPLHAQGGA
jgi:signal transduction histidine kinase